MAASVIGFGATTTSVSVQRDGVVISIPASVGAPVAVSAPVRDSYGFRRDVSRKLYDRAIGTLTSPSLVNLAPGASVCINPLDIERIGVAEGATVRVSNAHSSVTLPVRTSVAVPRGIAVVPFNQPGADVRELLRHNETVVDVRIEAL
jgi:hypothetical protein